MEKKAIHILIVEDHPLLLESFMMVLEELEKENFEWHFEIKNADSCDGVMFILQNRFPFDGFDLAVLDYGIAPSVEGKYFSGEEVGTYIRKQFPQTKILFVSAENQQFKIRNIFKGIDPEGFIFKGDSRSEILKEAVKEILDGGSYYSRRIRKAMRATMVADLSLDEWDRRILFELGRGTKTIQLPQLLPLSLSTVARRKRRLKEIFGVEGGDDAALVKRAREMGYG